MKTRFMPLMLLAIVTGCDVGPIDLTREMNTSESPSSIPEDLHYQRMTVPDEDNAILDWIRANEVRIGLDEEVKEALMVGWNRSTTPPDGEELEVIAHALEENTAALELLEASLQKPSAQWPDREALEEEPALPVLSELLRLRLFQAYQLRQSGRYADSAQHLRDSLRLSQIAVDSEGAAIHYLIGYAARSMVHQAIQLYALDPGAPEAQLVRLLEPSPPLDAESESYINCLRVEFAYYVVKPVDSVAFARQWTDYFETDPEFAAAMVPENLQRAFRVFLTPELVASHPHPFDQAWSIRKSAQKFVRYARNARSRWDQQQESPNDPEQLEQTFLKDARAVIAAVAEEELPLSASAIERARRAYNRFENPIGRLLEAKSPDVLDYSTRRVFQARTEREATRAIIALRIYSLRHGQLPERLDLLVNDGILPKIPQDAFAGADLNYSRDREIIWSVGVDGWNNKAKEETAGLWEGADAVWSVAALELIP